MSAPLLVLRIGYMARYDGPDEIINGGKYVKENETGSEIYNFYSHKGRCYGYAASVHQAGIDLGQLDASRDWSKGDELPGVDVVFIATQPQTKGKNSAQVVVGWYRNATCYTKM